MKKIFEDDIQTMFESDLEFSHIEGDTVVTSKFIRFYKEGGKMTNEDFKEMVFVKATEIAVKMFHADETKEFGVEPPTIEELREHKQISDLLVELAQWAYELGKGEK